MKNNLPYEKQTESRIRALVLIKLAPWFFIGLIVMIGLVRDCAGSKVEPIDNSYMKAFGIIEHVYVLDSTQNGFRVVYVTTDPVTDARLDEIRHRPAIQTAFTTLQRDAPMYFGGSLLYTDIYDFAAFAKRYDADPDIRMHNIFVMGSQKMGFYIGPNPNIRNPACRMDMGTEQGNLYLNSHDIYYRLTKDRRIYRYWKCRAPYHISLTEERFSHFSEEERLY